MHLFNGIGLAVLIVITFLTRAPLRRVAGAMSGGAAFGVAVLGIIALGQKVGWWHFVIFWEPYYLMLLWLDFAIYASYIYLFTWRIARRFGSRGLVVFTSVAAVIGPVRDRRYMERFPEWGTYGPGFVPVLAVAAIYVIMIVLGHWVMWLIAGPSGDDKLARRRWDTV